VTTGNGWEDERMGKKRSVVHVDAIQKRILRDRGQRIMLDTDLAEFYGVTTATSSSSLR
jgi:hypothetical protein